MNGENSSFKETKCGVPQGSVLGPLLFLIYINDLTNCLSQSYPIMYADDTNIFITNKDFTTIEETLNQDLNSLSTWLRANKLSLNVEKTHSITFSLNFEISSRKPNLRINNTMIDSVTSTNFLGVKIDNKLKWDIHINYIATKISRSIGILKKASKFFDDSTLRTLYNCLIHPYLDYCILIWGNAPKTYIVRLLRLQKRGLRVITHSHFLAHTTPLFNSQKFLKFDDIFSTRCIIFTYKIYSFLFPSSFADEFRMFNPQHSHLTRISSNNNVTIPRYRTSLGQKSLRYLSSKHYNEFLIPNRIFHLDSLSKLKKFLIDYFLSNYMYVD